MSGNTFCGVFWTDGKIDALMLPDQPRLVKCPHCQGLVWIDEQDKVGEIEPIIGLPVYEGSKPYIMPDLQDYLDELEKGTLIGEKEIYVRLRAWWSGNDKRRYDTSEKEDLSPKEIQNLKAFYEILDPSDDNDRVMMAEIQRELGNYEGAQDLLKKPLPDHLSRPASVIRELARRGERFVAEIK